MPSLFWVVSGLLLAYLAGCYLLARVYLRPGGEVGPTPKGLVDVEIPGKTLACPAWATPGMTSFEPRGKIAFILVHGFRGTRSSWQEAAIDLAVRGFEVVAVDLPGHGLSHDPTCSFGPKEAEVVGDAVAWVRGRWASPPIVILVGLSMGGAACWLAATQDLTIDAVVTEGSIVHLRATTDRWFAKLAPGGKWLLAPVRWFAERMSGSGGAVADVVGAARSRAGRPGLVIQGDADGLIPMSHAEDLAAAAGCDLWIIAGSRHAHGYRDARKAYLRRLVEVANQAAAARDL